MLTNSIAQTAIPMTQGFFIPDRQLTFSPELAATIGLDEAILLQGIGPSLSASGSHWQQILIADLVKTFPFWGENRIRQVLGNLADLGILVIGAEREPGLLDVATAGPGHPAPAERPEPGWQPDEAMLQVLALNHGIEHEFAIQQLESFDLGSDDHTRDSRFRRHVLSAWRHQQQDHPAFKLKSAAFDNAWQPSLDAIDIMTRAGIDEDFIESVRAPFVLYWLERGGPPKEVNSRFITHVRQQWTRHTAGLEYSREPVPMQQDWQPDPQVYDILAMSGIDEAFARERLPEFVLYWGDSNELHTSWNSKFLQHVKHQWKWLQHQESGHGGHEGSDGSGTAGRTRDRSLADDLRDTSWAD